ncbi:MAG: ATP/GTP-binding protein [Amphritea sp.]
MSDQKIVFFGPVGAGKTTAIRAVSEIDCIDTDAQTSDSTTTRKKTTTVAMDYGCMTGAFNQRVHLYGTPGQERFQFMWEMITTELAANCSGQILLLDNTRNYPQQDLEFYTREFSKLSGKKPLIVAVTGSDLASTPTQAQYKGWLSELNIEAPVYFIDARRTDDIRFLIDETLSAPAMNTQDGQLVELSPAIEEEFSLDEVIHFSENPIQFSQAVLNDINGLSGVKGAALIDPDGKLLSSTLPDTNLDELLQFLTSITPLLEEAQSLGNIENLSLTSGQSDHFSVFISNQHALGVLCSNQVTDLSLRQQLENIMQWTPA